MFSAARSRTAIARTPQPLAVQSRASLLLANGFASNSSQVIYANQLIHNTQDSKHYLLYGALTNSGAGQYGLAQSTTPDGPWTDLGALTGPPNGLTFTGVPQCRLLLTPDNKWSLYYVTSQSGTIGLYQTAAAGAINSTYTSVSTALISKGGSLAFDNQRCSEPFVFIDHGGTWRMLYMGMDSGSHHEQIGLATSSGDHTGPWTKAGGNPVIPNGAAGSYDAFICADPFVVYYNGTYYIFYAAGDTDASTGNGILPVACSSTTDFSTFTKRGIVFPTGLAGAADCCDSWLGSLWWSGLDSGTNTWALPSSVSTIYYTYAGRNGEGASSANTQAYVAKLDAQSIFGGAIATNPWTRIAAPSGDSHLSYNGATFNTFTAPTGDWLVFSTSTGNGQILTWTGRRARVWMVEANNYGIASIWLDGKQVGTYDACGWRTDQTQHTPVIAWDTGDLLPGAHTLEVRVTGTKNANSSDVNVGTVYWDRI